MVPGFPSPLVDRREDREEREVRYRGPVPTPDPSRDQGTRVEVDVYVEREGRREVEV